MVPARSVRVTRYVELQATTNFSFLRGASHPDELALQAAALGHPAIAVTDRNSLAGVVRAHVGAKEAGIGFIVGARLDLADGASLLAYPVDRAAYGRLSRLITVGRRRAPKGECILYREDVLAYGKGMIFVAVSSDEADKAFDAQVGELRSAFPGAIYLAAHHLCRGDDRRRLARRAGLAERLEIPLVATNDVLMHSRSRGPLLDVVTCIREKCIIDEAGWRLESNAERHLKSAADMARLFRGYEPALARTLEIADRCTFSLDELRYEYPDEITADGVPPQQQLERLTWQGAKRRYPGGPTAEVRKMIEHELSLIAELSYAPYFLTVYDLVRFAREKEILCQGRGSAANSAVCYCLGITAVDPSKLDLLFERFVSAERDEPPDIDVDFEHERREEVIQYIYEKYGRDRAGLAATVISYRSRSAVREVGLDPADRRIRMALELTRQLMGFPRHLSQHVGGFVITRGRLDELTPIENAAMEDRTVIEWNKDDLDALGMLKIDVLALGMLTCIRKGFDLIRSRYGLSYDLATIPQEDAHVYDMLCKGDSIGVFQVESRAQMAFLPRMKPRDFYDLVIEVAIVRPGPIQGDMVHPYLRRRNGEETVAYPSEDLRGVLHKTLGVPLFQEQAMRVAIVGAGFTPSEADRLRRAMATFRHTGTIHTFREKMINGMLERGYDEDFAERCFRQIEGFGDYGFPESHAASFALLVYVSAWMKCHYPAVFACALLNSQPMGFYAPAQLVRDARDHGVTVRPPDVNLSDWDCTLELDEDGEGAYALRLGLRQIRGFKEPDGEWVIAARNNGYADPAAIWRRAGLDGAALEKLARADAFVSMGLSRREGLWASRRFVAANSNGNAKPLPLFEAAGDDGWGAEALVTLPDMTPGEAVMADYAALRLSLRCHPMALLRDGFDGTTPADALIVTDNNAWVTVAGLVLARQRPGTAKGVIFATLEDETGVANVIVWPKIFEKYRRIVLTARLLKVTGRLQREGIVTHLIADRLENCSPLLDSLAEPQAIDVNGPRPAPPPKSGFRHPRNQGSVLFPSRDFH
ncbi:MAG: PHP domain-containing protein [Alphaproteobacteria bacterium]|nr:PHP domain-containing protein [Alphaproteobacteria bacterium]